MTRIAVIGAGIAGLAAARRLAEGGHRVVVFEKARGVSGRCATRRHEVGAFDHGAQYFTARSPEFLGQVEDWCRRDVVQRWDAKIVSLAEGVVEPTRGGIARYVGTPGMNALGKDLARGLEVHCETRIAEVGGAPGALTPIGAAREVAGAFDAVVVATPAEQSVPLLRASPVLREAAAAIAMQPCLASMVAWSEPLGVDFDGAFVDRSPLAWVARNASKPGRNTGECWVLHASPEWSASHLEDDPDTTAGALLASFARALGRDLPAPLHTASHRWRHARSADPGTWPVVWDDRARIGVCGDWTHGDRVEGAWRSGERLAREMADAL